MLIKKSIFACITLLLGNFMLSSVCSADQIPAFANCEKYDRNTKCRLVWDFGDDRNKRYVLQQWDRKFAGWQDVSVHKSKKLVKGVSLPATGRLYRVLSCDGANGACVSSSAVWSPDWTKGDDVPDIVQVRSGDTVIDFSVTKYDIDGNPAGPAQIAAQYNMYLIQRELENALNSSAELPPIVIQDYGVDGPLSLEDQVTDNVAVVYEKIRMAIEKYRQTGSTE